MLLLKISHDVGSRCVVCGDCDQVLEKLGRSLEQQKK